jgi:mediator of RNA polymerase II transcription subunit 6
MIGFINLKNFSYVIRSCNNEYLKMQRLEMNKLLDMTGNEYAVVHHKEPLLFVIQRQTRRTRDVAIPQAIFYVLHGNVYQSPDAHSVLVSRLVESRNN